MNVSNYESLSVSNVFGMSASSWASGSKMVLSYSTNGSSYSEVSKTGSNPSKAVSSNSNYATASYTLPAAAQSTTLYLKFEFYCSQTSSKGAAIGQAYLADVTLKGTAKAGPSCSVAPVIGSIK